MPTYRPFLAPGNDWPSSSKPEGDNRNTRWCFPVSVSTAKCKEQRRKQVLDLSFYLEILARPIPLLMPRT